MTLNGGWALMAPPFKGVDHGGSLWVWEGPVVKFPVKQGQKFSSASLALLWGHQCQSSSFRRGGEALEEAPAGSGLQLGGSPQQPADIRSYMAASLCMATPQTFLLENVPPTHRNRTICVFSLALKLAWHGQWPCNHTVV